MGLIELLLVAVGLSMDAFAVSVCKGLNTKKTSAKNRDCRRGIFRRVSGFHACRRIYLRRYNAPVY